MSHHEGKKKAAVEKVPSLVVTRDFDVPRETVWKAWAEPERVKLWWGLKPYTAPVIKMDFRVGGKYLFDMRSPEGEDFWSTGVYREIKPMERIVLTDSAADEKGNVVPATYYGMDASIPDELLVTVTFEDIGGKTRLTLRHDGMPASQQEGARQFWESSLEKLAESLE